MKLQDQAVEFERMDTRIDLLKKEIAELRADVRELVDAWNAARGIVRFVRLIGWVAAAVGAVFAAIKMEPWR